MRRCGSQDANGPLHIYVVGQGLSDATVKYPRTLSYRTFYRSSNIRDNYVEYDYQLNCLSQPLGSFKIAILLCVVMPGETVNSLANATALLDFPNEAFVIELGRAQHYALADRHCPPIHIIKNHYVAGGKSLILSNRAHHTATKSTNINITEREGSRNRPLVAISFPLFIGLSTSIVWLMVEFSHLLAPASLLYLIG